MTVADLIAELMKYPGDDMVKTVLRVGDYPEWRDIMVTPYPGVVELDWT